MVFLDKLLLPRSLYLLDDGILWANQESLFFQKRIGLKPVGERVVVDQEYARGGNVEHKANSLVLGLDNWIYNAKSDRTMCPGCAGIKGPCMIRIAGMKFCSSLKFDATNSLFIVDKLSSRFI